jgi:hypothetical protein
LGKVEDVSWDDPTAKIFFTAKTAKNAKKCLKVWKDYVKNLEDFFLVSQNSSWASPLCGEIDLFAVDS